MCVLFIAAVVVSKHTKLCVGISIRCKYQHSIMCFCYAAFALCLCVLFNWAKHSAFFHQTCPCHSSWLTAPSRSFVSHLTSVSLHPASLTASDPPQSDSVLSVCLGLDMEERTRQMKLKMNKYKQVAGSDSRLEQDYHKVKKKKNTSRYCEYMLHYPPCTLNI